MVVSSSFNPPAAAECTALHLVLSSGNAEAAEMRIMHLNHMDLVRAAKMVKSAGVFDTHDQRRLLDAVVRKEHQRISVMLDAAGPVSVRTVSASVQPSAF